jgi:hypothetical protein
MNKTALQERRGAPEFLHPLGRRAGPRSGPGGVAAALAAALATAACAPDAWTNVKASGFNAFLEQIADQCQPLYAGPLLVTRNFQDPAWDLQSYNYYDQWLDQTSRLYYRKITPQTYLENVNNLFGARSLESARCTVTKLPAEAPAPPRL